MSVVVAPRRARRCTQRYLIPGTSASCCARSSISQAACKWCRSLDRPTATGSSRRRQEQTSGIGNSGAAYRRHPSCRQAQRRKGGQASPVRCTAEASAGAKWGNPSTSLLRFSGQVLFEPARRQLQQSDQLSEVLTRELGRGPGFPGRSLIMPNYIRKNFG